MQYTAKQYGSSDTTPEKVVQRNRQYQVRYHITETTRTTESGEEQQVWHYEYVEVDNLEYKRLVDAMVRNRYDVNDEFNVRNDKRTAAYTAYQRYVASVKQEAEKVI